jgi:hypothetical protein
MASLENLYFSLFQSLPLNAATALVDKGGTYVDADRFNNYKLAYYYRNAYNAGTYRRLERQALATYLDPSVNMALPFGYATPDRTGGDADLTVARKDAVKVRGVFGMAKTENEVSYQRVGGGLSADVAKLASLPVALELSGSFDQTTESGDASAERKATRIMAGGKVGIWRGISLLAGYQMSNKEFGKAYGDVVNKVDETLLLVGPEVKIAERAKLSLQYGMLGNSIGYNTIDEEGGDSKIATLDLNKTLITGTVSVGF